MAGGALSTLLTDWNRIRLSQDGLRALLDSILPHLGNKLARNWAPNIAKHLVRMQEEKGEFDALLQTAKFLIAGDPDKCIYKVYKMRACLALKKYSEAEATARTIILAEPEAPDAFTARVGLVESSLDQGKFSEAVCRAGMAFDTALDHQQLSRAIQLVARAMAACDGDLANANKFLLFQKYGQAGADGKTGTKDGLPPFQDAIERSINSAFKRQLVAAAEKAIDDFDPDALHRRGMFYLHAGESQRALEAFQREYMLVASSTAAMQRSSKDVAVALRAASAQAYGAEAFLDYQQYGSAGMDGKPGTEDDLVFSFPAKVLSPADLSARAEKEFHEELLKGWHTMPAFEKGRRYAAALSLSGRHQEALSVAWGLYCSARDNRHLDAACVAVAGALRARDLSLPNANRFLAFQKHGANGPDGKLGTEDDAANPLAEFRVKLPAAHEEWLKAQAHSLIENGKYRDAGYAWLHAGDARQALSAFNRVRSVCPFEAKAIDEMTRDIVAALKALHGHPLGAGPFLAFQQYGPSGKDGQPGTADDLEDSLAEF